MQIADNNVMFGIIFWSIIAVVVLGFAGFGLNRAMAQRQAWREFASKHKLTFAKGGSLYVPGSVVGAINGRDVHVYSMDEGVDNLYLRSPYVHIEVFLSKVPAPYMLMAAKTLPEIIREESLPDAVPVKGAHIAQSDDGKAAQEWLAQGRRMAAMEAFMQDVDDKSDALFLADGEHAFLVWRTSNPMADARALNARVQKLFGYAKDLDV